MSDATKKTSATKPHKSHVTAAAPSSAHKSKPLGSSASHAVLHPTPHASSSNTHAPRKHGDAAMERATSLASLHHASSSKRTLTVKPPGIGGHDEAEGELSPASEAAMAQEAARVAALQLLSPHQEKELAYREVIEAREAKVREAAQRIREESERAAAAEQLLAEQKLKQAAALAEAHRRAEEQAELEEDKRVEAAMTKILEARGIKRRDSLDPADVEALNAFRAAQAEARKEAEKERKAQGAAASALSPPPVAARRRNSLTDAEAISTAMRRHNSLLAREPSGAASAAAPSSMVGSAVGSAVGSQVNSRSASRAMSPERQRSFHRVASDHPHAPSHAPSHSLGSHPDKMAARRLKTASLGHGLTTPPLLSKSQTGSGFNSGTASPNPGLHSRKSLGMGISVHPPSEVPALAKATSGSKVHHDSPNTHQASSSNLAAPGPTASRPRRKSLPGSTQPATVVPVRERRGSAKGLPSGVVVGGDLLAEYAPESFKAEMAAMNALVEKVRSTVNSRTGSVSNSTQGSTVHTPRAAGERVTFAGSKRGSVELPEFPLFAGGGAAQAAAAK